MKICDICHVPNPKNEIFYKGKYSLTKAYDLCDSCKEMGVWPLEVLILFLKEESKLLANAMTALSSSNCVTQYKNTLDYFGIDLIKKAFHSTDPRTIYSPWEPQWFEDAKS